MSQQEQKPQWFWCNKHGDFAVRPICPECEHLGQAFTSSVTPAPPEASHRALAERIAADLFTNSNGDEADRLVLRTDPPRPVRELGGWCRAAVVDRIVAALSTGTETQEPKS
jgi:hypothetical protein